MREFAITALFNFSAAVLILSISFLEITEITKMCMCYILGAVIVEVAAMFKKGIK